MFWPEHALLDGCFSFKMEDLVFILSCPDGLYKYWRTFFLKNLKKKIFKKIQKFKSIRTNALIQPFGNRKPVYLFKFFYSNVTSAV